MADVELDFIYKENIEVLQNSMQILFNNVKFSDTIFIVNNKKFHVLSQLVSVSSSTLDLLISSHVAHCTDKEIKINDVKHDESFSIILRYMYGLEINFTQIDKVILCEVLNLSETYKLPKFTEGLKDYISKLNTFNINNLAVLLNAAKTFNVAELYKKLSIYAYLNAEEFVKHDSIKDLQYDVLLDLLKSDWFYSEEINILRGVFYWHSDMYKSENNSKEILVKKNDNESVIEEQDESSDIQSDASDCETEESSDTQPLDEENGKDVLGLEIENSNMEDNNSQSINNHENNQVVIYDQDQGFSQLVKSFSDSVVKSLLSHIRIKHISMLDIVKASQTKLFKKYKKYISNEKYFSQKSEYRQKYTAVSCNLKVKRFFCVKKAFVGRWCSLKKVRSNNYHILGNLKFTISFKILKNPLLTHLKKTYNYTLETHLHCTSSMLTDWECSVECQLTLISHSFDYPHLVLPNPNTYKTISFTVNNSSEKLGEYIGDFGNWYDAYCKASPVKAFTFELFFKSLEVKG